MAKRALETLSTKDLHEELNRRQRRLPALEKRRDNLRAELDDVEKQIAEISQGDSNGSAGTTRRATTARRTRPKNKVPLGDLLVEILRKDQPRKVSDLAHEAKKAGYKTNAKHFSTIVNQTLLKDDRFKSSSRGYYELA